MTRYARPLLCSALLACSSGDKAPPPPTIGGGDDSAAPGGPDACAAEMDAESGSAAPLAVAWDPAQTCEDPLPSVSYAEVGAAMGLEGSPDRDIDHVGGGVLAVDDFDGDGDYDVLLGFAAGEPQYYAREGDAFAKGALPGMGALNPVTLTIGLVDLDGDGWRDLALAGPPTKLIRNLGGTFQETSVVSGLTQSVVELVPLDLEADGIPDFYAVSTGDLSAESGPEDRADMIIRGAAGPTWSAEVVDPDVEGGVGFDGAAYDWDGDGDLDVYTVNDKGPQFGGNVLWENDGGELRPVGDACACELAHSGMGVDVADYNDDGLPDLYLSATTDNPLLEALPDGSYVDVAQARGADPLSTLEEMSWGAIWLDHDNDGLLDLLVAEGDLWYEGAANPVVQDLPIDLLVQSRDEAGAASFADRAPDLGLDRLGSWRGVVAVDHNGDGVLDPLVADVEGEPLLFLSEGCTANGWLMIEAEPGSKVEICAGGRKRTAWATTESSWGGAKPPLVHFGLGDATEVERIRVTSPAGAVRYLATPTPSRSRGRVSD